MTTPADRSGVASMVVVTPCRDEAGHIGATIASMAEQSLRPALWVIVDDGSTDDTPRLLSEACELHPWIRVVRRTSEQRSVGPGVVAAFEHGLSTVDLDEYEFVVKLDADLELPPGYFEACIAEMRADPRLGNFSGKVWHRLDSGQLIPERMGDENAIGAAKLYRVSCFREIGGFVREVGWDGIDGHMCRLKGWVAASEDRPELRIIHRRLMGSSHRGVLHGRARWGRAKWFMGSAWYYMLFVAVYRMPERPWIVGGLSILAGYFGQMLRGAPRYEHPGFRETIRRFERSVILHRKSGAISRTNAAIRGRPLTDAQRRAAGEPGPAPATGLAPAPGPVNERPPAPSPAGARGDSA